MFSDEPPRETALELAPPAIPLDFSDKSLHPSSTSLLTIENEPADTELSYTPCDVEVEGANRLSTPNREPDTSLTSTNKDDVSNLINNTPTR